MLLVELLLIQVFEELCLVVFMYNYHILNPTSGLVCWQSRTSVVRRIFNECSDWSGGRASFWHAAINN